MVSNDKRYADLPLEVRAWLETLGSDGVVHIANAVRFYDEISIPRPGERVTPVDFLRTANPHTLEWLKNARQEEVDQIVEAVNLVRSGRTVGRFMKWAVITLIGAFILMSQFGDALSKIVGLLRGAGK
jgi:hypothetical protein